MPRMRALLVSALIIPLAASCQVEEEVGEKTNSILGGTPISVGQFPTVVALLIDGGARGLCTGTLVRPDLVLTAAHCVDPSLAGYSTQQQVTDNSIIVIDSTTLGQNGTVLSVAETVKHAAFGNPGDPDIGVVRLVAPVTDRDPSPVNFDPSASPVGTTVTMVGYGVNNVQTQAAGRGFFLTGKTSVSCTNGISNGTFLCFNQTDGSGKCQGDSGGPSFAMIGGVQTVVGITSFGTQGCQVNGVDMRTDASQSRSFLLANAPDLLCAADGHCDALCSEDPDCGSGCATDGDCNGAGQLCDTDVGTCYAGPDAPGGLGAPCGNGEPDCLSGICATYDGNQLCTETCTVATQDCPAGFECLATGDNGAGACFIPVDSGSCFGCNPTGTSGGPAAVLLILAILGIRRKAKRPTR